MVLTIIKRKFYSIDFIKNLFNKSQIKITLGRWSNENIYKTNLKVDYANEDHCGVCTSLLKNDNK
jgi:hypothetical protein